MKTIFVTLSLLCVGLVLQAQQVPTPVEVQLQVRPAMDPGMDSSKVIVYVELADANQTGTVHLRLGTANGLGDVASGSFALDGSGSFDWDQHISRKDGRVVIHLGFVAKSALAQTPLYIDARVSDTGGTFSAAVSQTIN